MCNVQTKEGSGWPLGRNVHDDDDDDGSGRNLPLNNNNNYNGGTLYNTIHAKKGQWTVNYDNTIIIITVGVRYIPCHLFRHC